MGVWVVFNKTICSNTLSKPSKVGLLFEKMLDLNVSSTPLPFIKGFYKLETLSKKGQLTFGLTSENLRK